MEIRPILSALLRSKTGAILVALQVAISLGILANALHIVNVRQGVASRPSGLADEGSLFTISVQHLKRGSHEEQVASQRGATAALRAVGGVTSAAFVNQVPMSQSGSTSSVAADSKQDAPTWPASVYYSADSMIQTWGLKLVEGRDFSPADVVVKDATADRVPPRQVIVTQALAKKTWPDATSVIGKTLYFGTGTEAEGAQVVGVVERLQTQGAQVSERGLYSVILPALVTNDYSINYAVRAEKGQRERVMKEAEAALRKQSATPVLLRMQSIDEVRKQRYRSDMALSWMLVTVSALLLLITASGIVGMASLWVQQRRKQIGVRRALGARRVDILRYFLTENFMITSAGIGAGVLFAVGLNSLLVSKLEMARLPLGYLGAGAALFWLLGLLAVYGPAWRAASISPATATRSA
ncbi:ABC transporter permease [Massilia glaciei]|uniref:ABC transporter permease n=1 Tax=Massilia glaciei TaxID=1524097 RepID=A0A2U2HJA4_9BURK|nr:FtsX-like permease family protein [Massilia glaciei]PWF47580.1 ABC transporter permease [Massilia glaciei]